MELVGLFRWELVSPVQQGAHREEAAFAMSDDRDAIVVFLEMSERAIEPGRFFIESGNVAEQGRLESVKDEVVVPIEARILQQDLRFAPCVDVIANKSVDENNYVL